MQPGLQKSAEQQEQTEAPQAKQILETNSQYSDPSQTWLVRWCALNLPGQSHEEVRSSQVRFRGQEPRGKSRARTLPYGQGTEGGAEG